jgi:hypothetical protein
MIDGGRARVRVNPTYFKKVDAGTQGDVDNGLWVAFEPVGFETQHEKGYGMFTRDANGVDQVANETGFV